MGMLKWNCRRKELNYDAMIISLRSQRCELHLWRKGTFVSAKGATVKVFSESNDPKWIKIWLKKRERERERSVEACTWPRGGADACEAAATSRRDAAVEGRWVDDDGANARMPLPLLSQLLGIFSFRYY